MSTVVGAPHMPLDQNFTSTEKKNIYPSMFMTRMELPTKRDEIWVEERHIDVSYMF